MGVSPTGRRIVGSVVGGLVAGLALTGCTSASEEPSAPAVPAATSAKPPPSAPAPGEGSEPVPTSSMEPSAAEATAPDEVTIEVTIADGKVDPNGKKLDVEVGQRIVLFVTSDEDDEVHAHNGGDGYELEVEAGTKVRGEFTLDTPGSYEVESHHLGKTIVILNAR